MRDRTLAAGKALHTFAANREAADHLTRALQLIRQHPELENVPEQALVQSFLATIMKGGVCALPVKPEPEELEELAPAIGGAIIDRKLIFQARVLAWGQSLFQARHERACEISAQLLHAAEGIGQYASMQANLAAGMTSFYLGEFPQACEYLEKAVLLYDPDKHRPPALVYLEDRVVAARSHLALALWHLGFPDRAVTMSEEAISLAREFEHPYSLAYALCYAAVLRQYRQEPATYWNCAMRLQPLRMNRDSHFGNTAP